MTKLESLAVDILAVGIQLKRSKPLSAIVLGAALIGWGVARNLRDGLYAPEIDETQISIDEEEVVNPV